MAAGPANAQTYTVDPAATDVRILVYRGGLLRRLGHNHVISVKELSGTVELGPTPGESMVRLRFPVSSLVVDDTALRDAEGGEFSGEISSKDKNGTRKNMLGRRLLDAVNFGEIRMVSSVISGELPELGIQLVVWVKDKEYSLAIPITVALSDDELVATGELVVSHAELGLRPFSAAFGTLRVRRDMLLRYRIVAERSGATVSNQH